MYVLNARDVSTNHAILNASLTFVSTSEHDSKDNHVVAAASATVAAERNIETSNIITLCLLHHSRPRLWKLCLGWSTFALLSCFTTSWTSSCASSFNSSILSMRSCCCYNTPRVGIPTAMGSLVDFLLKRRSKKVRFLSDIVLCGPIAMWRLGWPASSITFSLFSRIMRAV